MPQQHIAVTDSVVFGNDLPFVFIGGPCQLEGLDESLALAESLTAVCGRLGIPFVFKASFDKANRTSLAGPRGLGLEEGLRVFEAVKTRCGCPVLTDVHAPAQCAPVAEVVDILQIPALLARQTDLLLAAGATGRVIHVKKAQNMAPWDVGHVLDKIASTGNERSLICERGYAFGYNRTVVDMRGLALMAASGHPVVIDAGHAIQEPSSAGGRSGGDRREIPVIARAAVAVGVAAVFTEVHEDPDHALSDGPNSLAAASVEAYLRVLQQLDRIAKAHPLDRD
jgi:2-dehydro-3-deoxyphosphooctonate aldolase (KDO 8-P synthase)